MDQKQVVSGAVATKVEWMHQDVKALLPQAENILMFHKHQSSLMIL